MAKLPPTVVVKDFSQVDYSDLDIPAFVIYNRPTDFPLNVVVRIWDLWKGPSTMAVLVNSIEEARKFIPGWAIVRIPNRNDPIEPQIVETWF